METDATTTTTATVESNTDGKQPEVASETNETEEVVSLSVEWVC